MKFDYSPTGIPLKQVGRVAFILSDLGCSKHEFKYAILSVDFVNRIDYTTGERGGVRKLNKRNGMKVKLDKEMKKYCRVSDEETNYSVVITFGNGSFNMPTRIRKRLAYDELAFIEEIRSFVSEAPAVVTMKWVTGKRRKRIKRRKL